MHTHGHAHKLYNLNIKIQGSENLAFSWPDLADTCFCPTPVFNNTGPTAFRQLWGPPFAPPISTFYLTPPTHPARLINGKEKAPSGGKTKRDTKGCVYTQAGLEERDSGNYN